MNLQKSSLKMFAILSQIFFKYSGKSLKRATLAKSGKNPLSWELYRWKICLWGSTLRYTISVRLLIDGTIFKNSNVFDKEYTYSHIEFYNSSIDLNFYKNMISCLSSKSLIDRNLSFNWLNCSGKVLWRQKQ